MQKDILLHQFPPYEGACEWRLCWLSARSCLTMSKLPKLKGKELIKILAVHGFHVIRIKGNHHFIRHEDGRCTVVPVHAGETRGPGPLLQILKDTELDRSDLVVR